MKKISLVVLAVALVIFGVTYVGTKADEVKASTTLVMSEDKSYGTLTKAEALATINTTDSLTGNDIPNYEGYLFAGWFADEKGVCSLDTASSKDDATHAKFVKEDTLSVKFQIVEAGKVQIATNGAIRFISSVDSLDYSQVGFKVNGEEYPVEDNVVYERIDSTMLDTEGKQIEYEYSPKIVGTKAEYFFTAKLAANTTDKDYKVQAYWKTVDGTKVYGQERTVCVNDNASNIINMTLDGALTVGEYSGAVTITSMKNATTTAVNTTAEKVTVTNVGEGYSNVRIELPSSVKVSQFASATTITVGSASGIFRNHNTAYAGTAATIDTSWYDEYPSTETEFVISGSADLYGMAKLALRYTDKAIYVCSDITVNTGILDPSEYENEDGWNAAKQNFLGWTPFSIFAGKFDGQGHAISGIYLKTGTPSSGLFTQTLVASNVKDFKLLNSYFEFEVLTTASNRNAFFGSVAGGGGGTFESIYSEATIVSDGCHNGGIVGGMNYSGSISNCQFSGSIDLGTNQGQYAGGILGCYRSNAQVDMINCLNTGALTGTHSSLIGLGGLCAYGWAGHLNMEDSVTVGTYTGSGGRIASVIARLGSGGTNATAEFTNVYYDSEKCATVLTENKTAGAIIYSGTPVGKTYNELVGSKGWYDTALDFGTYWSAISEGTPQLKSFAEGTVLNTLGGRGTEAEPWTISNADELKLLSNYANSTYNFEKKYIKLVDDIIVVEGNTITDVKTKATKNWNPIGTSANPFAGTFDGDGNSISGIYYSGNGTYIGLFGATGDTSNVKNLEIKTSYFETTNTANTWVGSVAGVGYGTFEKIKSSATMVCNGAYNGGIVGSVWQWGSATFDDCWFAGSMDLNSTGTKSAGIIGGINMAGLTNTEDRAVTINNCLNTGSITEGKAQVGGICGIVLSTDTTVNFNNCLNAKRVDSAGATGAIVADVYTANITVTMTDSFAVKELQEDGETYYSTTLYGAWRDKENSIIVDNGCKIVPIDDFETGDATKILEKLFVPDSENVIHWITVSGSTPILSCFAN